MENQQDTKQSEKQSEWRNRELGALWVRNGKNQKYLSGTINVETMPGVTEPVKVVVFTNKGKEKNERAPDYVIYRSEDRDQVSETAEKAVEEVASQSKPAAQTKAESSEEIAEELF